MLSGSAIDALGRFGRPVDLLYKNIAQAGLLRYAYGYDKRGNRTFADVDHQGTGQDWVYGYDGLNRLTRASQGTYDPGTETWTGSATTSRWHLDDLGNWSDGAVDGDLGTAVSFRRFTDVNGDCAYDPGDTTLWADHHETNQVNELESRTSGRPTLGTTGSGAVLEPFWYDANGNLLFDNRNLYAYDAFNRLVSVKQRGTVYVDTQADELAGVPGEEIAHYYYDALNRRVRTVNKPGSQDEVQVAHVFGGGAQVLAEYLVSIGGSQPPGGPDVLQRWFVHGQSFPDPLVMVDRTTTVGSSDPAVDDYYWYLKDALGSVGALADANGAIVERYTYDPYGQTHILLPDGTPLIEAIERSFYHDIDFDGMVGANEKASLDACVGSYEPRCLWLHDANGDGHVNQEDVDIFAESGWTSGDDVPVPPMWRRPAQPQFDVADRGSFDLLDYMQFTMCVGEIDAPTADEFCRILFDADGDADVDQYDYSLWDHRFTNPADQYEFPSQSRFGNPFMWTGQRYDASAGLYHFFYRSYAGDLGRFKQQDPLGAGALPEFCKQSFISPSGIHPGRTSCCSCNGGCGGQTAKRQCSVAMALNPATQYKDGLSLYQYVGSRPLIMTDPDGRFTFATILIAGVLGGKIDAAKAASDIGRLGLLTYLLYRLFDTTVNLLRRVPWEIECEWGYAWCKWGVTKGVKRDPNTGRPKRGWHPDLTIPECEACYGFCKATGRWPQTGLCKLGGGLDKGKPGKTYPPGHNPI